MAIRIASRSLCPRSDRPRECACRPASAASRPAPIALGCTSPRSPAGKRHSPAPGVTSSRVRPVTVWSAGATSRLALGSYGSSISKATRSPPPSTRVRGATEGPIALGHPRSRRLRNPLWRRQAPPEAGVPATSFHPHPRHAHQGHGLDAAWRRNSEGCSGADQKHLGSAHGPPLELQECAVGLP